MKKALIVFGLNLGFTMLVAQDLTRWKKEILATANTGVAAAYLTDEEKKVLLLTNLARMDGVAFIKNVLDPYVKENSPPDNDYLKSLYTDLRAVKGLGALAPNEKLCQSADYHANDMGSKGLTGHDSSNGTPCFDRIHRFYRGGYMGECCSYGYGDALGIVMQLLIDNEVPSKGHRQSLLSTNFKQVGVSIKPHKRWDFNCVMDFSD